MHWLRNYPIKGMIVSMIVCVVTSIFFPWMIPQPLANICLLILLICSILVRLQAVSSHIKQKHN